MQSKLFSIAELSKLVSENCYISNSTSNKSRDINSLSYLINRQLSQSDCIKLGIGVEKSIADIITSYNEEGIINIKPPNINGQKERDHLFKNDDKKLIYYSELKSNINLDTEKSKITIDKCNNIVAELKLKYPEYNIKWCLLSLRYISNNDIPTRIKSKYISINNNLYGINDYINMFGIKYTFTEELYKEYLNKIADEMFN